MTKTNQFYKSNMGAQAAWKGFSSQTLYIASRIVSDTDDNHFFPEDIEDLVIKNRDKVVEVIQIKNVAAALTVSLLSSTKSSISGEGFFNRVCSLHDKYPELTIIKVVYFNSLGTELEGVSKGDITTYNSVKDKLVVKHKLSESDAEWLLSSLVFEKADISTLEQAIISEFKEYVETMAAPEIAKLLLIQYVSELSKSKGSINKASWIELIHKIGIEISSIDGYYKEYNKSLVRLSELTSGKSKEQLSEEFSQGISTHPDHIRNELDFRREQWLDAIDISLNENNVVIVKGVSGQGKSAICYRYMLENYPEELVFCIRHISSVQQAANLAVALNGISKHTPELIVYLDVNSNDTKWSMLVQEMNIRKINIPVLISIRDEDFNLTPVDGSLFAHELIEVQLSKVEAESIYDHNTSLVPHDEYRSFEESWISFGGEGPLMEYIYFLTNNQTLTERLKGQINNLLLEKIPDSWFEILKVVCNAGKIGGAVSVSKLKNIIKSDDYVAAIQRFKDEYLVRETFGKAYIEALHPIRATILSELLESLTFNEQQDDLLNCIRCVDSPSVQYLLMEYFTEYSYNKQVVRNIASAIQEDWSSFAGTLKAMLWLDVKRYYESNIQVISELIEKKGISWLLYMPKDISGLLEYGKSSIMNLLELNIPSFEDSRSDTIQTVDNLKASLSSLSIDFEATDLFILNATLPSCDIKNENDCDSFGYSLFWVAKRNRNLTGIVLSEDSWEVLLHSDYQACANAVRGMFEHSSMREDYEKLKNSLLDRFLADNQTVIYSESETEVICKFVPPTLGKKEDVQSGNSNFYWIIRAMNILQQIFSTKEYIEVELLGLNFLKNFGIEPIDYKKRIPKSNRLDNWIVDINSWFISRVYYMDRPSSWNEYVDKVEEIRITSNILISDAIKLLDNYYLKKFWSKKQGGQIDIGIKHLSALISKQLLLPRTAVYKYCLYREDMQNNDNNSNKNNNNNNNDNSSKQAPLQFLKYKTFRRRLTAGYSSVANFFNNFLEVLSKRVEHSPLDDVNLDLGLINLYDSLASISKMQREFDEFFENYQTKIRPGFNEEEIGNLNIMLNLWHYVIETPPKGYQIAYKAKQEYREAMYRVETLHRTETIKDISVLTKQNRIFFLKEIDEDNDIHEEYNFIAKTIHRYFFKRADQFSSEKWLIDNGGYEFIYIPLFNGKPLNSGFVISSFHVFGDSLSKALIPTDIDKSVYEHLNIEYAVVEKRSLLNNVFSTVSLLIHQYNYIAALNTGEYSLYKTGIQNFAQNIFDEIYGQLSDLSKQIENSSVIKGIINEEVIESILALVEYIRRKDGLIMSMKNFEQNKELEILVDNVIEQLAFVDS